MFSFLKKLIRRDRLDSKWVNESEKLTFFFKEECEEEARLLLSTNKLIDGVLETDVDKDPANTANDWIDSPEVHIRENNDFDCTIDYFLNPQPSQKMEILDASDPAFAKANAYIEAEMPQKEELGKKLVLLKDKTNNELYKLMKECGNQNGGITYALEVLGAINDQNQAFLLEMRDELKIMQTVNLPKEELDLHQRCAQLADGGNLINTKASLLKKIGKEAEDIVIIKREILRRRYAINFFHWLQILLQEYAYAIRKTGSMLDYLRQSNNQKLAKMISTKTEGATVGPKDLNLERFIATLPEKDILQLEKESIETVGTLINNYAEQEIKASSL